MSISLFQIPKPIEEQMKQLNELVEAHPLHLPLSKVARLLGTKDESLRAAIDCGNFSPGYSWRKGGALNKGYCIPTVPFYLWYTQYGIHAALIEGEKGERKC